MKKIVVLAAIMTVATVGHTSAKQQWTKVATDEYGETFVDSNHLKRLEDNKNIVEYGYKYIYKFGVPSINIAPKGYIQAIHRINCKEKAKATVVSQRFTPKGKALDPAVPYDTTYFEPIYEVNTDLLKVYKFVCKAK